MFIFLEFDPPQPLPAPKVCQDPQRGRGQVQLVDAQPRVQGDVEAAAARHVRRVTRAGQEASGGGAQQGQVSGTISSRDSIFCQVKSELTSFQTC